MRRFQKVLVPIEGDPPRKAAVARAARLAKRNGAAIKLIAVVEDVPWYTRLVLPDSEARLKALVLERSEALEKIAEELRGDGIKVATEVLTGRRRQEVVKEVLRGGHDLLLKEAEPNDTVLFGSTDMYLLRVCPCPLWLVKPDQEGRPFKKVLAAVDPAPPADEADLLNLKTDLDQKDETLDLTILGLATSVAEEEGAELHVVHAWSAPGEGLVRGDPMLAPEQVDRYVEDSREEARKAGDRLLEALPDPTGRRRLHLLKGDPADVIAGLATSGGFDLIVMGTVARSGIPGLVIGNTAESILQRVDCSVLAVKPDGFVSPVRLDH